MGLGSKLKKAVKKVGKAVKKVASNPVAAGAIGFAIAGPAGAAAGFQLGSTVAGIEKQKDAQKNQEKAAGQQAKAVATQNRRIEIQNARARRQAVASARQAEAELRAEAAGAGGAVLASSAVSGGLASIQSQLAESLGFSTGQELGGQQVAAFESAATKYQTKASKDLTKANTYGALAGLPSQLGLTPSFASALDFSSTGGTITQDMSGNVVNITGNPIL